MKPNFYKAHQGNLTELVSLETEKPEYSDNEGHFESSGHGRTYNSGNVREMNQGVDEHVLDKHLNKLVAAVKEHISDDAAVYLFVPDHLKNQTAKEIKKVLHNHTVHEEYGNYVNNGPDIILEKISALRTSETEPSSPEAKKNSE